MSDLTVYDFPNVYKRLGIEPGGLAAIMLNVEPIPVTDILEADPDWFYFSKDPALRYVKGPVAESIAHATLLYGLTPDANAGRRQKESVDELLAGLDLSEVTVDHIDTFPPAKGEPYACVVAKLSTDNDLGEANRRLRFLPHVDSYINYVPHVTLAYMNPDFADEAVSKFSADLNGITLPAIGVNYGGQIK